MVKLFKKVNIEATRFSSPSIALFINNFHPLILKAFCWQPSFPFPFIREKMDSTSLLFS